MVVIFVVRTILQAKKKQEKPPPQHRIPVHFVDDDEGEYFRKNTPAGTSTAVPKKAPLHGSLAASSATQAKLRQNQSARLRKTVPAIMKAATESGTAAGTKAAAAERPGTGAVSPGQKGLLFNLNQLSQMKQAVVMAEILGPPKGMQ